MPHKPGHERRELAATVSDQLGMPYRIGQGLRRAASPLLWSPHRDYAVRAAKNIAQDFRAAGGGLRGAGVAVGRDVARAPANLARQGGKALNVPGAEQLRDFRLGVQEGVTGAPPRSIVPGAAPQPAAASPQAGAASPSGLRRSVYMMDNVPDGGAHIQTADGRRSMSLTPEQARATAASVTSLSPEEFIRSGYDASAVVAARQAAMQRGDFGAVRRSLMSPEERAADDEARQRASLRRQAAGNGRGLNQTPSQAFADLQQRRAARRELDRLHELDLEQGRNETQLAGEGLRRVTAQEKADRAGRVREQDIARENLKRQHSDEEGNIRDPFAYSFDEARLLASSDEDPDAVFRLDSPTGRNLRFQAQERLRAAMNQDRGRLFNLPRRISEYFHGRSTEIDPVTTLEPSFEGVKLDEQGKIRIPLGANGDARISYDNLKEIDPALAEYVSVLLNLDNPSAR